MPYVTSIERLEKEDAIAEGLQLGLAQGRAEGREEAREEARKALKRGILKLLQVRFGDAADNMVLEIDSISDTALLERILDQAAVVASLDELRKLWK